MGSVCSSKKQIQVYNSSSSPPLKSSLRKVEDSKKDQGTRLEPHASNHASEKKKVVKDVTFKEEPTYHPPQPEPNEEEARAALVESNSLSTSGSFELWLEKEEAPPTAEEDQAARLIQVAYRKHLVKKDFYRHEKVQDMLVEIDNMMADMPAT